MKSNILILILLSLCAPASWAVDFNQYFSDSTLRIDYALSGKPGEVQISLRQLQRGPKWAGRRTNLDKVMWTGNGDIAVTTLQGDTIYRNSYSTLFSEWLDIDDNVPTVCQTTLLAPYPKQPVIVTTRLLDKRHEAVAIIKHLVTPSDILIRENQKPPMNHVVLKHGTYEGPHIGVAFLAEGYTKTEMAQYLKDCRDAMNAILSHEPFAEMAERFDFIAVQTPSNDSGVSVPKENKWKDTAFKSHFSTFYSDRYLTSPEVWAMHDALNGIPADHIIVLANSDVYGGGGIFNNYTLTAAHHAQFAPVVVHEFGHSFGGLGDEYFNNTSDAVADTYPLDVEPWEPNITTMVDFESKWQGLLRPNTPIPTNPDSRDLYPVGVYEGAGYSAKGIYRPADVCRMRVNNVDAFCPACQDAIRRLIIFYTE